MIPHAARRAHLTESREALAKAEREHGGYVHGPGIDSGWRCWCGADLRGWWPNGGVTPRDNAVDYALREHRVDALIASGAVVPADTLADDEALVQWVTERVGLGPITTKRTQRTLRHLATALSERGGDRG